MTAPYQLSSVSGSAQTPGPFGGRRRFGGTPSPQGDGGGFANGLQQMPQQGGAQAPQRPHYQTSHPPAPSSGQAPTFAQLQQSGQARPAPPPSYGAAPQGAAPSSGAVSGDLSRAVSQALQNPSAYGSQQVQDTFNMLNQRLGQDYDYQRKTLADELARRGISESTIAGQRYSDLATEQARAEADLVTQLTNQAAQTYGSDRNAAIQSGLGYGNLGVSQGNLDLARQLGVGNLGIAQQQANTGAQSVANQYALGQGQLGISQQAQDLARQLGVGNLNLGQQQLAQQGSQFTASQAENARQFNLSNQLAQALGLGNLDLNRQQLSQQGSQFDRSLAQQQQQNDRTFGLQSADVTGNYNGAPTLAAQAQNTAAQQFQQQLAQQLGIATMSDKTANRNVDLQAQIQNNDLLYRILATVPGLSGLAGLINPNGTNGSTPGSGGSNPPPAQTPPPPSGGYTPPPDSGGSPSGPPVDDPTNGGGHSSGPSVRQIDVPPVNSASGASSSAADNDPAAWDRTAKQMLALQLGIDPSTLTPDNAAGYLDRTNEGVKAAYWALVNAGPQGALDELKRTSLIGRYLPGGQGGYNTNGVPDPYWDDINNRNQQAANLAYSILSGFK